MWNSNEKEGRATESRAGYLLLGIKIRPSKYFGVSGPFLLTGKEESCNMINSITYIYTM
jgi:hypothetical protein